jgi:glycosyltransferase involved in cell wall biosynthesis
MPASTAPLVSVVLPVYNGMPALEMAVDSILAQTYRNWRLIIVNDGSTDGTGAYLDEVAKRDVRITVYHQSNQGVGAAGRTAVLNSDGVYVARMDADDISAPTRLEKQVAFLEHHADHILVATWPLKFAGGFGIVRGRRPHNDPEWLVDELRNGRCVFTHGSTMFRRSAYLKTQGYRFPDSSEDFDLWLQLSGHGKFGVIEEFEYLFRVSPNGVSSSSVPFRRPLNELAMQLDRERRESGREQTDAAAVCRAIKLKCGPVRDAARIQLTAYIMGTHHQMAGAPIKAAGYYLRSIRPNMRGLKAIRRVFKMLSPFRLLAGAPVILFEDLSPDVFARQTAWTKPWFERMGLPGHPYQRMGGKKQG